MQNDLSDYIANLDMESRLAFSEVLLGQDADAFLTSDLGRTMVGFAQQEYTEALLALETVPWYRKRRIQALQAQAWRAKTFVSWLKDLVIQGRQAESALKQADRSD